MTENPVYVLVAQGCCYFAYAWGLTRRSNRAVAIVAVRFVVGLPIAAVAAYVLARPFGPYLLPVAISAPIAWRVAGLLDPKASSMRLWLYWVLGGTALTFAVNLVVSRNFLRAAAWPFG